MRLVFGLALASVALAQAAETTTLTLASTNGRTQFRQGEAIALRLTFAGAGEVRTTNTERLSRKLEYERFAVEPAEGTADPFEGSYATSQIALFIGRDSPPVSLRGGPVDVDLCLNEWISFRRPGHYRVLVESTRLNGGARVQSNVLELEIVEATPEWQAQMLKQAVAVFEHASGGDLETAARTLRYLETPDAARAMVRFLGQGFYEAALRAGIAATPFRREAIAALEEAMDSPDVAIYRNQYSALQQFAAVSAAGPPPAMPEGATGDALRQWIREVQEPYRERARPAEEAVTAKVMGALEHKKGEALAVSLSTLGLSGLHAPPGILKALIANFRQMPLDSQGIWLISNWPRIASPDLVPLLTQIASGEPVLREAALTRLNEIDPAAARPLILDFIRRGGAANRALLSLPDPMLPQLDDALVTNFERRVPGADLLLARYGSPAAAGRVKIFVKQQGLCNGAIMAYLFRAVPDDAAALVPGGCSPADLLGLEDLILSPALEQELIRDLMVPGIRETALRILSNAGSWRARQPLMDTLLPGPVDANRAAMITTAAGWRVVRSDSDMIFNACTDEECHRRVVFLRQQEDEPVNIKVESDLQSYAAVGPFRLRSAPQVREKLLQFPKGTSFRLSIPFQGTWWAEEQKRVFRQLVEDAGMKLVR